MDALEGGAMLPITGFWLGNGRSSHTGEQPGRPVSQVDLSATNALQATSWQIDPDILDVCQRAQDAGHPCAGVDRHATLTIPDKMPPDEFKALDPQQRLDLIRGRRDAIAARETWREDVQRRAELLDTAAGDAEHPALWIVYGHDSRLRRYPRTSTGPSPQGHSMAKGLLRFADGVELGHDGLYWLNVRAAGDAGRDKLTNDARAEWSTANMAGIVASAQDPLACDFWWRDEGGKDREHPWGFLQTCFEINGALSSDNPLAFRSKLPVNVDGTCNGLQHLSAMGLDPSGARATNLTADPQRHDIYMLVAARVTERVSTDVAAGLAVAVGWQGKIDRKLVKRATMTTPYGVTSNGMKGQLLEDGLVDRDDWGGDAEVSAAATYIRDVMWSAIGEVVVAARNVMDWLQTTAGELAKANVPFRWTTPAGSTIQQSYRPWSTIRPLTAFGRIYLANAVDKTALKPRKQSLAAAPNYVHSFDAAHMALTINEGARQGISHWCMIHDSYGTHAAHMPKLNRILRDTFADIYAEDWLTRTYNEARSYSRGVEIAPPPTRGNFDINQVRESSWFFA